LAGQVIIPLLLWDKQAQLAHHMTWLDPIDDRKMVQQLLSGKLDCSQGAGQHVGSIQHVYKHMLGVDTAEVWTVHVTVDVTMIMSMDATVGVDMKALE